MAPPPLHRAARSASSPGGRSRLASSRSGPHGNINAKTANSPATIWWLEVGSPCLAGASGAMEPGGPSVSKTDRKNADRDDGVPRTLTTIPLTDPHAVAVEPSIGELVRDATAQMSTLVRAEVELARAEITRDVKEGLTGSI